MASKDEKISDYDNADGGNYRAGLVAELAGNERRLVLAEEKGTPEAVAAAKADIAAVKAELHRIGVDAAQIAAHRAETRV